jgi:hypothetical protein
MRRRGFLAASLAAIGALAARRSFARAKRCAAVVVGVDRPAGLTPLHAAASGASDVARWLHDREGFDVTALIDTQGPIHFSDVFAAVRRYVQLGTVDQLVIYFAGHGFMARYDEIWLLSDAPSDPNDAIGLNGTKCLAQQSGIPNVVLISDCCRSTAGSLGVEQVQGGVAFPGATTPPDTASDVDVFRATLVGNPAWEVPVDVSLKQYKGIFTATLLDAFRSPDASMVSVIDARNVVTNAKLKGFLISEVPKRAQAVSITLTQRPQIEVVSGDRTFIGHVLGTVRPLPPAHATTPTMAALVSESLSQLRFQRPDHSGIHLSSALASLSAESGFADSTQRILAARGPEPEQVPTLRTGFIVTGRRLRTVATPAGVKAAVTDEPAFNQRAIALELGSKRSASVAVRFSDGTGCVLAALRDFAGKVAVDEQGVANVSYEPTPGNPLWAELFQERERVELLRATVATAAKYGEFRIEGGRHNPEAAAQMGDRIRVLKMIDCSLGIYAAYAYADAALTEDVRSVNFNLQSEYGATFFDVAMLADKLAGEIALEGTTAPVPPCPMLSQGWSLLPAKRVKLPEGLDGVHTHLMPSLWTTFDPRGMDQVERLFPNIVRV